MRHPAEAPRSASAQARGAQAGGTQAGAALVVVEGCLGQAKLWTVINDLLDMPGKLQAMGQAAAGLGKPRAAEDVVNELEALVWPWE